MTRETKIGLLVGLAFIIVIGILLSDHLTTATEPQQAYLPQVGGSVRSGVTIPGAGQQPQAAGVTVAPVTPPQPVPTVQDLAPRPAPVQIVEVGPSGTAPQPPVAQHPAQQQQERHPAQHPVVTIPPIASAQSSQSAAPPVSVIPTPQQHLLAQAPVPEAPSQPALVTTPTPPGAGGVIAAIARRYGEDVVTAGGGSSNDQPQQLALNATTPAAPDALLAGAKQYKALEGDSLSKIATKVYGQSNRALRDAIVRANPSLQKDANLIIAGRTYVIPAVSGTAPPPPGPSAPAPAAPVPAPVSARPAPVPPTAAQPEYVYKVKEGDTLWKIAAEQLGNAAAVAAIKDLNQDVLKGSDVVRPNMKLRLPAKPIATAS